MKTIHKYKIKVEDTFTLKMPKGAEIISIQAQYDVPQIWAIVDEDVIEVEVRDFLLFTTGAQIDINLDNAKYLGTVQLNGGSFVFHIFELII